MVNIKKRGVSPIIATVLLVAFAIALGAMVINFSNTTTQEIKDSAEKRINYGIQCSMDMSIKLAEIEHVKQICYNRSGSNNLEAIIENQGSMDAEGIQFALLDANNNPYTVNSFVELESHSWARYNISLNNPPVDFNFAFPPVKIMISPVLTASESSAEICTDSRIDIEDIEDCDDV